MLDIFRREIKYEIDPCLTEVLKQRLSAVLPADPHNGTQGYLVRSVYFDTPDAADCCEKLDGVENRKKLRLRVYGFGDAPAKLELLVDVALEGRHSNGIAKVTLMAAEAETGL